MLVYTWKCVDSQRFTVNSYYLTKPKHDLPFHVSHGCWGNKSVDFQHEQLILQHENKFYWKTIKQMRSNYNEFNIWTDLSSLFSYQPKKTNNNKHLFKHIKNQMYKFSHHIRVIRYWTSKFRYCKIQLSFPCRISENVDGILNSHIL